MNLSLLRFNERSGSENLAYTPFSHETPPQKKKKKKKKKTNKQTEQSNKDKTTKHLTENLRIQEISKERKKKNIYIYIYLQLKLTPSTVDKEKPFQ